MPLYVFDNISILLIILVFNAGCVETQGYYNNGEEELISLICNIAWATKPITHNDGTTYPGLYKFNKNGTYTIKTIKIDKNGTNAKLTLMPHGLRCPKFQYHIFGGEHYWDIDKHTKDIFSFYDRSGDFEDLMTRE